MWKGGSEQQSMTPDLEDPEDPDMSARHMIPLGAVLKNRCLDLTGGRARLWEALGELWPWGAC